MICSLDISNFLKEISSLSYSVVFLYFSALIAEKGFLISCCYSLELCIQMLISFLFSYDFHFSSFHSKFGKLSSGHRIGKGQFSFQSQRKVMPKNAQTTAQLHSSHMLVKWSLKFFKPGFSNTWTINFQMVKLVLEKAEEAEIKLPTSTGSWKKQESSRKTSISALLTMPNPLTVWITINCGKFWKRWDYQTTWSASWEICRQVRKQQLELDMEQQTGSK